MVASSLNGKLMSLKFVDSLSVTEGGNCEALDLIRSELKAYFEGTLRKFKSTFMPLASEFYNRVWQELRNTTYGQTKSYSDIALLLGKPASVRAVAKANASNHCLIIVPCHRIIAKDGSISGFAAGVERKIWLLEHELKYKK